MFHEYDTAVEHYGKVLSVNAGFWPARMMLGNAYVMKGMFPEAVEAFRAARNLAGETTMVDGALGYALALSGDTDAARACLAGLRANEGTRYVRPYDTALIHTALGETERALDDLERAYRERGNWLNYLRVDPAFDALRGEERFRGLLEKVFANA